MSIFPLADAQKHGVTPAQLDDFILRAYRYFSLKLSSRGAGVWFYVWHDEVSGTLRCSLCRLPSQAQLPFSCRLNVIDTPGELSVAALASPYNTGIPLR